MNNKSNKEPRELKKFDKFEKLDRKVEETIQEVETISCQKSHIPLYQEFQSHTNVLPVISIKISFKVGSLL